ncbi:MAG: septum site-determining protein Ssd, partial [Actinomycetes bacterium]
MAAEGGSTPCPGGRPMPNRPLLVTADDGLLDDLLRICAAAGAE